MRDIEAVKEDVRSGKNYNSSRPNTKRYGQIVTDPAAQQAVAESIRNLDEFEEQLRSGNREEAIKLLDKAMSNIRRAAKISGDSAGIAVTDPGVPTE
ncbi:MAG: hypothetical protein QXX57_05910 [Nitrososphaerota archaeon]